MRSEDSGSGRLHAKPHAHSAGDDLASPGLLPLRLARGRDGVLYVPRNYGATKPAGLLVLFHGAGGNGRDQIEPFRKLADRTGFILLGPDSRGRTWDVILGGFGPDVAFLDQALEEVFARYSIDPESVAAGGFSDGASYALSIGLTNGNLFHRIVAFSPGFIDPAAMADKPRFYVSHGIADNVLPIDRCSRRLVPALERAGYQMRYHEFSGGHTVPPDIAEEAFAWLRDGEGNSRAEPG